MNLLMLLYRQKEMDSAKSIIRNDPKNIEVNNFKIKLNKVDADIKMPYSTASVYMEFKNVSITTVNTLRRVLMSEMTVFQLKVEKITNYDNRDLFIITEALEDCLEQIPLKLQIDQKIVDNTTFSIDIYNDTDTEKIIYSGDLQYEGKLDMLLFNPTIRIATLDAGKRLYVESIKIVETEIMSNVANFSIINLDLKHGDDDYAYEKPSTEVDSMEFSLSFNIFPIRNENEIILFIKDAIKNIINKARKLLSEFNPIIDRNMLTMTYSDNKTLSELIVKTGFDLTKNSVEKILYTYDTFTYLVTLEIVHPKPDLLLRDILQQIIFTWETIRDCY